MTLLAQYHCYTDGSCKAADGAPGGWGYVIKRAGQPSLESYGSAQRHTFAKVMEYRAVAEALLALPAGASATVFCDNRSLVENMLRNFANWLRCDFANVDPSIVDSARSIATSIREKQLVLRWQWLRAHNGNAGNERADALAAQAPAKPRPSLSHEALAGSVERPPLLRRLRCRGLPQKLGASTQPRSSGQREADVQSASQPRQT